MAQQTITRPTAAEVDQPASSPRWQVWLVRACLAAAGAYAVVSGERGGAVAATLGLALSWAPALLARRGGVRAPRMLEVLWVLAVTIPAASDALGAYDRVTHWGKLVHGVEGGLTASMAALLLLGFAQRFELGLPGQLAALGSLFVGVLAGAVWEFVEFLLDWVRYSDLQKSNTDTMTDLLWSNLAAGAAALLMVRLYHHGLSETERVALGTFGECLLKPLGRLLDRHGRMALLVVALVIAASIAGLWFAGRPIPGLPVD
jgi:hypothetical protein